MLLIAQFIVDCFTSGQIYLERNLSFREEITVKKGLKQSPYPGKFFTYTPLFLLLGFKQYLLYKSFSKFKILLDFTIIRSNTVCVGIKPELVSYKTTGSL